MSLNPPTAEEQRWMADIVRLGCCVCLREGLGASEAEAHHMLDGGRRMGHLFTLPLCFSHHRGGLDNKQITSRDHNKRRFEARYGSEQDLLAWTKRKVEELRACQV